MKKFVVKVMSGNVVVRESRFKTERVSLKFAGILQDAGFKVRVTKGK